MRVKMKRRDPPFEKGEVYEMSAGTAARFVRNGLAEYEDAPAHHEERPPRIRRKRHDTEEE